MQARGRRRESVGEVLRSGWDAHGARRLRARRAGTNRRALGRDVPGGPARPRAGREFIAGTLADAVSLGELMDALGAEAFWSTQRNALAGRGNIGQKKTRRSKAPGGPSTNSSTPTRLHQPSGRQSGPMRFGSWLAR